VNASVPTPQEARKAMGHRLFAMAPELAAPPARPIGADPIEHVLTEALYQARQGRGDVAITNLCHAVQVLDTRPAVRELCQSIIRVGGGFA